MKIAPSNIQDFFFPFVKLVTLVLLFVGVEYPDCHI